MLNSMLAILSAEMEKSLDSNFVRSIRNELARAAQKEYDAWEQDEEGHDEYLGGGGVCQDVADGMAMVLSNYGIEAAVVGQQVGEQHVFVVVQLADGVFAIDIPPFIYESGGGYSWRKKKDVVFSADDVLIDKIDDDPGNFDDYVGD